MLGKNAWQRQYEISLAFYDLAAELASFCGAFDEMDEFIDTVIEQTHSLLEQVNVYRIRISSNVSRNNLTDAIAIAQQFLQQLGIKFPEIPSQEDIQQAFSEVRILIGDQNIEYLINLPKMTDNEKFAILQIANSIIPATHISGSPLFPLVVALSVNLSIQYGNTSASAFAYACYGFLIFERLQDIDPGVKFGQLALELVSRLDYKMVKSETLNVVGFFILHRKFHIKQTIPLLQEAYLAGLEVGNFEFIGLNAAAFCFNSFLGNCPLSTLEQETQAYYDALIQLNQKLSANYCLIYWQSILNLLEENEHSSLLSGKVLQEAELLPQLLSSYDFLGLYFFYIQKLILCYLFEEIESARNQIVELKKYLIVGAATVGQPIFYFYDSLSALASLSLQSEETSEIFERVKQNQTQLQKYWAEYAPMNHQHKYDLVEAEKCRVLGQKVEAIDLYDSAIAGAKENEYIQEEALANELFAKFYLDWGREKEASVYMQEAYYCYARWGAKAKTKDIEKHYPHLLQPILQQSSQSLSYSETLTVNTVSNVSLQTLKTTSPSSGTSINSALDFATVLKASQALSGIIQLDELVRELTKIILYNAGGDRCALILPNSDGNWEVKAITTSETTELCAELLEDNLKLPVKLIQYVKNTQDVVVIDNLHTDLPVIDEYLREQQPKSLLCLPILNQGQLIGILSLENHSTSGVFTSDRLFILNFLCTQAAISLENAHIYHKFQRSEAKEREKAKQLEQTLEALQTKNIKLALRSEIDEALTRIDELPKILQSCTEKIVQYLDAAFARIWTLNANENVLELQASAGQYTHLDGPHSRIPVGKFKIGLIAQEGLPHLTNDVLNDPRIGNKEWAKQENMVAFAGYPLIVEEQLMGVIALFARKFLSEEILDTLKLIANEIALGIKRKQVEQALQYSETQLLQQKQQLEQALQQLEQSQLQIVQSEKMSALGNLVAGVAHEINNPTGFLQGNIKPAQDYVQDLMGLIDLYQEKMPDPAQEIEDEIEEIDLEFIREDLPKLLESMNLGVKRIRNISNSLRTFSRQDQDYKTAFYIHEGIDSTLLILKHRTKANEQRPQIQVIKHYGEIPQVQCFPGQLNQVFMNILANAIDAFEENNCGKTYTEIEAIPNTITIQTLVNEMKASTNSAY